MMEQVKLCAVLPRENWLGASLNKIQGWTTVRESYSRALKQGRLLFALADGHLRRSIRFLTTSYHTFRENYRNECHVMTGHTSEE